MKLILTTFALCNNFRTISFRLKSIPFRVLLHGWDMYTLPLDVVASICGQNHQEVVKVTSPSPRVFYQATCRSPVVVKCGVDSAEHETFFSIPNITKAQVGPMDLLLVDIGS